MKKKLLIALAVSAVTAASVYAAPTAAPGAGVLNSVHDMNVVGGGVNVVQKDLQGRVCAFCHTPHHAIDSTDPNAGDYMPLWSHKLTTQGTFNQYDSATYNAKDTGVIDPLIGPTRLCMSCHDGAIAPDQHYGATSATNHLFAGNEFTGAEWQIGIGANGALNRTHPIGFDLAQAVAADENTTTGSNPGAQMGFLANLANGATFLNTTKTIKSQLYNGTIMTCATCHDVHNKDNVTNDDFNADHPDTLGRNYLVFAKQAGSQLCLSCHNK